MITTRPTSLHAALRALVPLAAAACAVPTASAQTGACCYGGGQCDIRPEFACVSNNVCGIYLGNGSTCPANCPTAPTGACCFSQVLPHCLGIMTACECSIPGGGGAYMGNGSTCAACPDPMGACCLPNLTCVQDTAIHCSQTGGVYRGNGFTCAAANCPSCYPNCDSSTASPILNVADFTCFLQKFAASDTYANCDSSTATPVLNVADFTCFLQKFAAGC